MWVAVDGSSVQGVEQLLMEIFTGNYELCAQDHETLIEALVQEVSKMSSHAAACIECLKCLVVVDEIPIQHSQHQLLTHLNRAGVQVLSGMQVCVLARRHAPHGPGMTLAPGDIELREVTVHT